MTNRTVGTTTVQNSVTVRDVYKRIDILYKLSLPEVLQSISCSTVYDLYFRECTTMITLDGLQFL